MVVTLSMFGVGAAEQEIDLNLDVGRITRPHQLFCRFGLLLPGDDRFAAGGLVAAAAAWAAIHIYFSFLYLQPGCKSLPKFMHSGPGCQDSLCLLEPENGGDCMMPTLWPNPGPIQRRFLSRGRDGLVSDLNSGS